MRLLLLSFLLLTATLSADSLILLNGSTVKGTLIGADNRTIRFAVGSNRNIQPHRRGFDPAALYGPQSEPRNQMRKPSSASSTVRLRGSRPRLNSCATRPQNGTRGSPLSSGLRWKNVTCKPSATIRLISVMRRRRRLSRLLPQLRPNRTSGNMISSCHTHGRTRKSLRGRCIMR